VGVRRLFTSPPLFIPKLSTSNIFHLCVCYPIKSYQTLPLKSQLCRTNCWLLIPFERSDFFKSRFNHISIWSENCNILPKYGQFPPQNVDDLHQGKSGQHLLQMRSSFLNQLKIYLFNPSSNHQGLTKLSTSPYIP